LNICVCPGFSQDRVNFHQKPGGDTTRQADPNRTGYSIPCTIMLGSGWGSWPGDKAVAAWKCAGHRVLRVALCISLFVLCILIISIVVVAVHFVCCSDRLPLSRSTSFLPVSFHSPPHPSGGRGNRATVWPFVAGHGQTKTALHDITI